MFIVYYKVCVVRRFYKEDSCFQYDQMPIATDERCFYPVILSRNLENKPVIHLSTTLWHFFLGYHCIALYYTPSALGNETSHTSTVPCRSYCLWGVGRFADFIKLFSYLSSAAQWDRNYFSEQKMSCADWRLGFGHLPTDINARGCHTNENDTVTYFNSWFQWIHGAQTR